jgi:predicted aspartyl protease
MGRFAVTVELANNRDLMHAEDGDIPPDQVRRLSIKGWVDTGASRLVIPQSVVERLGLSVSGKVGVRNADGRREERPLATGIHLTYGGRSSVFNAIVEPGRDSALIGAIVLEDLDFVADCNSEMLVPRDPEKIISEVE